MIADSAAGLITMRHGLHGPSYVTASACASGNNAMIDAFNYIRLGTCVAVVTGGSEAAIYEAGVGGFNALHAMSTRNDDPATASRPYDKDRDGFVLGRRWCCDHSGRPGTRLGTWCEDLRRSGRWWHEQRCLPHHRPASGRLGCRAVHEACVEATLALHADEIDYINTHGTSTPIGDPQEVKAIQRLFGEHAYKLNISATKSMTGHLLGGAGAVEGVAAIMAVHTDIVPPTINHFTDDPELDPEVELHVQHRAEAHRERGHEQHLRVWWAQHLGDLPQVPVAFP